ncbi:hypothetical protein [Bacillus pumilus]|uniref:beta barrel domain-containing protein n=1 Tax=Bacillus pumilus TaxID=1408 RepID=UPI0031F48C94
MKVGDKVYLRQINRMGKLLSEELHEWVIVKIGRKFIYVGETVDAKEHRLEKFIKEDLRHQKDYGHKWELYFSKKGAKEKEEYLHILRELRKIIPSYGSNCSLDLNQLRKIAEVAGIKTKL